MAVKAFGRSLAVQAAGAFFATYLRAVEYCLLEDPSPIPRTEWAYVIAHTRDTFLPLESGSASAKKFALQAKSTSQGTHPLRLRSAALLERPHLAAPGSSYPVAVVRLVIEAVLLYFVYDVLLTLCVKRLLGVSDASFGDSINDNNRLRNGRLPPLLSVTSLVTSVAFTATLFLHFAIWYRMIIVGLSLLRPSLLTTCRHQFQQPWLGITCVSELWQRWHQLFRTTFVRLAHRPARAMARRLLQSRQAASTPSGNNAHGIPAARIALAGKNANTLQQRHPPSQQQQQHASWTDSTGDAAGGPGAAGGTRAIEEGVGVLAVFLLSGIMHEFMCWAAFGAARGWQLTFFLAHGLMVVLEQAGGASASGRETAAAAAEARPWRVRVGPVIKGGLTAAFCLASSVVFMRPWVEAGYHWDFWHPVSPAGWLLGVVRGGGGAAAGIGA